SPINLVQKPSKLPVASRPTIGGSKPLVPPKPPPRPSSIGQLAPPRTVHFSQSEPSSETSCDDDGAASSVIFRSRIPSARMRKPGPSSPSQANSDLANPGVQKKALGELVDDSPARMSFSAKKKFFEQEISQQHLQPKSEKQFSYLSQDEVAQMQIEEQRKLTEMTEADMRDLSFSEDSMKEVAHWRETLGLEGTPEVNNSGPHGGWNEWKTHCV
ncbi:unnamed protein product, partial [Cyprideis torosa]